MVSWSASVPSAKEGVRRSLASHLSAQPLLPANHLSSSHTPLCFSKGYKLKKTRGGKFIHIAMGHPHACWVKIFQCNCSWVIQAPQWPLNKLIGSPVWALKKTKGVAVWIESGRCGGGLFYHEAELTVSRKQPWSLPPFWLMTSLWWK